MVEPLDQQDPVGQPGQRIVQGLLTGLIGGVPKFGPGLGVDQVGSCHIGQGLGRLHLRLLERPRGIPVKVERSQLLVVVMERKRKYRHHAGLERLRPRTSGI